MPPDAAEPEREAHKRRIAIDTLERYTGSKFDDFQRFVLLVNFEHYVEQFLEDTGAHHARGTVMTAAHHADQQITMIQCGVGSPTAALAVDLLSYVRPAAVLILGLCGGLRKKHRVGDYFNPVAAIRDEGTSEHYMPPQCPALANFSIQKFVTVHLERTGIYYHTGVVHTTNYRFWEFDESFRHQLLEEKVQAIDMECATLFSAGFSRAVPVGALLVVSDLPLEEGGVKTKDMSEHVRAEYTPDHVRLGTAILRDIQAAEAWQLKDQW